MAEREIDKISGVETTGHEWDGIKELNNPAPRWWLLVLYASIIWSIGYWVVYPAWPTLSGAGERGGTEGIWQWTQYKHLKNSQAEIIKRRGTQLVKFRNTELPDVLKNAELLAFAKSGGASAFKDNCATCHGTGGAGAVDYPNLNDDEWIWGGTLKSIYTTIKYGIRSGHEKTHSSEMPSMSGTLKSEQVSDLANYVLSLSGKAPPSDTGAALYKTNCAACHGDDGQGDAAQGAPNLKDAIWLHSKGGKPSAIASQILKPKHGVMPHWEGRLDEDTIRLLTIYVHSLGGGK